MQIKRLKKDLAHFRGLNRQCSCVHKTKVGDSKKGRAGQAAKGSKKAKATTTTQGSKKTKVVPLANGCSSAKDIEPRQGLDGKKRKLMTDFLGES